MAERRMFSAKVICSDAFMSLPKSAQVLYFQICMRADDDGFLNNAGQIVKSAGVKPSDLRTLISKRFLLEFFGGIILVKHWRMANSLKRDRAKPPLYPVAAANVYIKSNKSYTDHPVDGCPTLLEYKSGYLNDSDSARNPDGFHSESDWNPKGIDGNRREEKGTEEKGIEGGLESAEANQPTPESAIELFFAIRQEQAPSPIPPQLLDKAGELIKQGVTAEQLATVYAESKHGFLAGDNKRGWRANLGWLLDRENFQKVLTGQYRGPASQTDAAADRVQMGTSALGDLERRAIARMLLETQEETS